MPLLLLFPFAFPFGALLRTLATPGLLSGLALLLLSL